MNKIYKEPRTNTQKKKKTKKQPFSSPTMSWKKKHKAHIMYSWENKIVSMGMSMLPIYKEFKLDCIN